MKNILIAEDDEALSGLYTEILEAVSTFHVIAIVWDGSALIEFMDDAINKGKQVDVVILDQRLPGRFGLDLIPEIRDMYSTVKIIIVSGDSSIERRAIDAGADLFLLKPFGIEQLVSAVKKVTNGS